MFAIYARVSTEDQAKYGYSIQDQIRQCRVKIGDRSSLIAEYKDEGITGEVLERPGLEKLIEDINAGVITNVMCYKPDRLSRNLLDALKLTKKIEKKAKIEFVDMVFDNTPQGMFFYQNYLAMAELEKNLIKERTMAGRKSKARSGKVVRDYNVYGYTYNKEKGQMEIKTDEAEVVQLIFELFTNPQGRVRGINGIANYLNENNIPTKMQSLFREGKSTRVPKEGKWIWHKQVVRQILFNSVYIGEFYQNKWNTEGMLINQFRDKDEYIPMTERPKEDWILVPCPPIVDVTTYNLAQKLLKEARRRYAGTPRNTYLLSGLVRCGDCGNTMVGRKVNNWNKHEFHYSDIKNTAGAKNHGCGNHIKCNTLDEFVWSTFIGYVNTKGQQAVDEYNNPKTSNEKTFEEKQLEQLIKDKEKQMQLKFLYQDDYMLLRIGEKHEFWTLETITEKIIATNDNITRLENEIKSLEEKIEVQKANSFTETVLLETISDFLSIDNESLTIEKRQEFLRRVFKEIRVYENGKVEFYRL